MRLGVGVFIVTFILELANTAFPLHIDRKYVIDLLQNAVVWSPPSPEVSVTPIPAPDGHSIAYLFEGSSRSLQMSPQQVPRLQALLRAEEHITLLAAVKQKPHNTGSIISFAVGNDSLLEVESSGRKRELRLHYHTSPHHHHHTKASSQQRWTRMRTEIFPFHLADNQWHTLALSISKNFVQVFIDCNKLFERQTADWINLEPLAQEPADNVHVWLGQRGPRLAHFKGAIEYITLVVQPQGYLEQCPYANVACPTCSQFSQLEDSVHHLYKVIEHLNQKLLETEDRLAEVEKCECTQGCVINGTRYRDGESWTLDYCTQCTCRGGSVECEKPKCPPVRCRNPVIMEGQCCPTCLISDTLPLLRTMIGQSQFQTQGEHCYFKDVHYDHGETFSPRQCISCNCTDGRVMCHRTSPLACPRLLCPMSQQVIIPGECCKTCKGVDYCAHGNHCHINATCINLPTRPVCQCMAGLTGDGRACDDIDECQEEGGHRGHHCHSNTICVNTHGSYECQCREGFVRLDRYTCEELNECDKELHNCHGHAQCVNTEGSFYCDCAPGYHGNGTDCKPVCTGGCHNGGECIAPETCLCAKGFIGKSCHQDLNECERGLADCHPNSECVNYPGAYYCRCKSGYHSNHHDNKHGMLCRDLDECGGWGGGHQCPEGTECSNTPGDYQCVCPPGKDCSLACVFDGVFLDNGTVWDASYDRCITCTCKNGQESCKRRSCDCRSGDVDLECCPQCGEHLTCPHQEEPAKMFYSGETWTYHCQTCHCLDGETDCSSVECPPLSCSSTVQLEGDCCSRCQDNDPCHPEEHEDTGNDVMLLADDTFARQCFFEGKSYDSGDAWNLPWDLCTSCSCLEGHLCCSFDESCHRKEAYEPAANTNGVTQHPLIGTDTYLTTKSTDYFFHLNGEEPRRGDVMGPPGHNHRFGRGATSSTKSVTLDDVTVRHTTPRVSMIPQDSDPENRSESPRGQDKGDQKWMDVALKKESSVELNDDMLIDSSESSETLPLPNVKDTLPSKMAAFTAAAGQALTTVPSGEDVTALAGDPEPADRLSTLTLGDTQSRGPTSDAGLPLAPSPRDALDENAGEKEADPDLNRALKGRIEDKMSTDSPDPAAASSTVGPRRAPPVSDVITSDADVRDVSATELRKYVTTSVTSEEDSQESDPEVTSVNGENTPRGRSRKRKSRRGRKQRNFEGGGGGG